MTNLLQGSSLLVALLAGMVALFAPCCISVMLPAYFAGAFRRRRALIAMTFVFAAGVATVILPIALGATAVSRLIFGYHTVVFLVGGLLLLAMGAATLTGWRPKLPMLGMRASGGRGVGSVYVLGVFSGAASACCAPVLAGVIALSGAAASFPAALTIGAAYVLGMVLPLFVIAVLWDRFNWGRSRLFTGTGFTVRIGRRSLTLQPITVAGGLLLIGMGVIVIQLAFTGPAMNPEGWQAGLTAFLDHIGSRITAGLSPVPGWAVVAALVAVLTGLGWLALRRPERPDDGEQIGQSSTTASSATRPRRLT